MESGEDDVLDVSKLSFRGDFDVQVDEILAHVRLTRAQVEYLQCLIDDLVEALSKVWRECEVYMFGSIVTGLGIKTSDVDCYIKIQPHLRARGNPVIQSKNILRTYPHKFTELFAIMAAKVPILKFLHIPTSFHCDINFISFAGVKNSQLIAFMLDLDPRALKLAIIIKYWSKVLKFTGTNLMANYSLTMMVIFYLQMVSVLPSVEELQKNVPPNYVENWNAAFDENIVYSMGNSDSLYDLLGGFFDYYSNFDYERHIICPYMGIPISKELFTNLNTVPSEFSLYKSNVAKKISKPIRLDSCLCVQDPFDHSRNCSVALYARLFNKIHSYFKLAVDAFNTNEKDKFLRALFTMTTPVTEEVRPKPNFKNKVHKKKYNVMQQRYRTKNPNLVDRRKFRQQANYTFKQW